MSDLQNSNDVRLTRKIYREKPDIVDLGVTDDVTGQVKLKMLDDLSCSVLSRSLVFLDGKVDKSTWIVDTYKEHGSLTHGSGTHISTITIFVGQI